MAQYEEYMQERRSSAWTQASLKGISWGAIFAGAIMALSSQLVLSLLGMGIGFVSMDFASGEKPLAGIGIGTGIWWSLSMLVSLFLGGWVAGNLAGVPRNKEGFLHGMLSWGIVTIVSVLLLTTAVGVTLGGMGSLIGKTLSASMDVAARNPERAEQFARSPEVRERAEQAMGILQRKTEQIRSGQMDARTERKSEEATQTLSAASFGAFVALILGALSAGLGGAIGAPKFLMIGPIPRTASPSPRETVSTH